MEQAILKRIQELTERIDELLKEKELMIGRLKEIDRAVDNKWAATVELKALLGEIIDQKEP